jgi:hypothetical protein
MSELLADPGVALRTCATFLLIAAPCYLVFRWLVKLARQAYGFDVPAEDEGPPLRICARCHNTVLEPEFSHCPYCGAPLPAADGAAEPAPDEVADDVADELSDARS